MMLKIKLQVSGDGKSKGWSYPVDMSQCRGLRYAHDYSFVLCEGPDSYLSVPGVSLASPTDEEALLAPEDLLEKRQTAARTECERRIVAVASVSDQMNLSAAAAAGFMTPEQMTAYQAGVLWINDCRNTWRRLAAEGGDINADENWPVPADEIKALADAF